MPAAEFWLIAGPNGAGKTTALARPEVARLIAGVRWLNADDRTLAMLRAEGWSGFAEVPHGELTRLFVGAANEVQADLEEGLTSGECVGTETVLSTDKFKPLVQRVHGAGGTFGLLYIALRSSELSARRVAIRAARGGHDVPVDRLAARWQRSVENLGWFARHADRFWVYDNSDSSELHPPLLLAEGGAGVLHIYEPDAIPEITASLTAAFAQ